LFAADWLSSHGLIPFFKIDSYNVSDKIAITSSLQKFLMTDLPTDSHAKNLADKRTTAEWVILLKVEETRRFDSATVA
jgi:hypothetical protein